MTVDLFLALLAFAFVSSITPGPNNIMLMASGANFGLRRTVPHMLGVGIGFMVMIALVGLGLAGVFEVFPVLHTVLKVVAIIYMLWLAWKIATAAPTIDGGKTDATPMTFLQAAAFQWVNPKAWTMALTAILAYVPPNDWLRGMVVVTLAFGAVNIPCVTVWAWMGMQVRRFLGTTARLRAFNITMAVLLVASIYPIIG